MQNILTRKASHESTFGVYQNDSDVSFKIGRSSFKYNDKLVLVGGKIQDNARLVGITNPFTTR